MATVVNAQMFEDWRTKLDDERLVERIFDFCYSVSMVVFADQTGGSFICHGESCDGESRNRKEH